MDKNITVQKVVYVCSFRTIGKACKSESSWNLWTNITTVQLHCREQLMNNHTVHSCILHHAWRVESLLSVCSVHVLSRSFSGSCLVFKPDWMHRWATPNLSFTYKSCHIECTNYVLIHGNTAFHFAFLKAQQSNSYGGC